MIRILGKCCIRVYRLFCKITRLPLLCKGTGVVRKMNKFVAGLQGHALHVVHVGSMSNYVLEIPLLNRSRDNGDSKFFCDNSQFFPDK